MEGLDQVIVGAGLQAFDLVLPARARGQDQDREFLALGAQVADQVHARHLRQAEVDHGDVERQFAAVVQAFLAIAGGIDREPFALQPGGQCFAQRGFIFDQQNTHVVSLDSIRSCEAPDQYSSAEPVGVLASSDDASLLLSLRGSRRSGASVARIVLHDPNAAVGGQHLHPIDLAAVALHRLGAQHLATGLCAPPGAPNRAASLIGWPSRRDWAAAAAGVRRLAHRRLRCGWGPALAAPNAARPEEQHGRTEQISGRRTRYMAGWYPRGEISWSQCSRRRSLAVRR